MSAILVGAALAARASRADDLAGTIARAIHDSVLAVEVAAPSGRRGDGLTASRITAGGDGSVIAHLLQDADPADPATLQGVAARLLDELVADEDVEEVFGEAADLAAVLRATAG